MSDFPQLPLSFTTSIVAIAGGVARYLVGYVDGGRFKLSIFIASAFVSGFSGWMFALMGLDMNVPQEMIYMMAGVGGFMGEQTMKFILEYLGKKI